MRKLSENTLALIAELHRPQSRVGGILGMRRPKMEVIELLGKSQEIGAVPTLLPHLLDPSTRSQTVAALAEIMEQATLNDLVRLHGERTSGAIYQDVAAEARRWIHLKPRMSITSTETTLARSGSSGWPAFTPTATCGNQL